MWNVARQIGRDLQSDDLTITRLTLSYVGRTRPHSDLTIFWRVGGGYYHLASDTSDVDRGRLGAHGGAGVEMPLGKRLGVAGNVVQHVIPGRRISLARSQIGIYSLTAYSVGFDLRLYF